MEIKYTQSQVPDQLRDLEIDAKQVETNEVRSVKELVAANIAPIGDGHLDRLIGGNTGQGAQNPVSFLDGLKQSASGAAGARDRAGELMGDANGGFIGSPAGRVSEDPAEGGGDSKVESPSLKDILINFILGVGSKESPVPLPPTPPDPETGRNLWDGVSFFREVLGGNNYESHVNRRGGIDEAGTPIRDADPVGPPSVITPEILKGIEARLGAHGEPNPESQAGTGGPVDESKTAGAASGPAGEPAIEVDRAVVTSRDVDAIKIRLESKFKQID